MRISLEDFTRRVLRRLNVPDNADVGTLDDGKGGTTLTTQDTIVDLINEVGAEIAESCWPLPGSATGTVTSALPLLDIRTVTIDDADACDSMWLARGVDHTTSAGSDPITTTLAQAGRAYVQAYAGKPPERAATGTPTLWYRIAQGWVGFYPVPSEGTLSFTGLCRPVLIDRDADTGTTDVFPWLPAQYIESVVAYVAARLAEKQAQDQTLSDRIPLWREEYNAWRTEVWKSIDPITRQTAYPMPPGVSAAATGPAGRK